MFGSASKNVAHNAPLHFWKLISNGVHVVDWVLMKIKDDQVRHQSALDRMIQDLWAKQMDPSTIVESIK
jgi:hypothetical protein